MTVHARVESCHPLAGELGCGELSAGRPLLRKLAERKGALARVPAAAIPAALCCTGEGRGLLITSPATASERRGDHQLHQKKPLHLQTPSDASPPAHARGSAGEC